MCTNSIAAKENDAHCLEALQDEVDVRIIKDCFPYGKVYVQVDHIHTSRLMDNLIDFESKEERGCHWEGVVMITVFCSMSTRSQIHGQDSGISGLHFTVQVVQGGLEAPSGVKIASMGEDTRLREAHYGDIWFL